MKKVLFIIDAQNDFCHPDGSLFCHNGQSAVNNIVSLLKDKTFDQIIVTEDHHCDTGIVHYLDTNEGKHLPVKHCIDGTWGALLHKDIYIALYEPDYDVIQKYTFMADPYVVSNNIISNEDERYEFYICGFATDICVLNNALLLKHLFNECEVNVIENCCAGTSENMHDMAIQVMRANHINII